MAAGADSFCAIRAWISDALRVFHSSLSRATRAGRARRYMAARLLSPNPHLVASCRILMPELDAPGPGTRPGLHGQTLVSTGQADLDRALGGGLPLGCLLLILEDAPPAVASTLLRLFLAEGSQTFLTSAPSPSACLLLLQTTLLHSPAAVAGRTLS